MTPRHLIALLVVLSHGKSAVFIYTQPRVLPTPNFWWDITLDRSALISYMIFPPLTTDIIDRHGEDLDSQKSDWDLRFAQGSSMQWLAGDHGFWSIWNWNSSQNKDITGGGFIFNETVLGVAAGANWLHDAHNGSITWNCFVEGNAAVPLTWSNWEMRLDDGTKIGFKKQEGQWGFITGEHTVLSKHCAAGNPVVGKIYRYFKGKEVASSVKTDPFKYVHRRKRSPDFFEKISQGFKNFMEKVKKFFSGDQQDEGDGQNNPEGREGGRQCNTILDLMVRIIDLILGRRRQPGGPNEPPPSMPPPQGGIPQGPNGEIPEPDSGGGDPPGGADVPPPDAEELDPSQNDAVRDWE